MRQKIIVILSTGYGCRQNRSNRRLTYLANAPAVPLQVVPGQLPAVLPAEEVGFGMVVHHCATRRVGSQLGWFPVDSFISILIDNLLLKGGDLNERVGEFPTILLQKFGNMQGKRRWTKSKHVFSFPGKITTVGG